MPDVHELNRRFYAQEPWTYFRDRLSLLTLRAGASRELDTLVRGGVDWGPFSLGGDPGATGVIEETAAATTRFVVTEAQVLHRQVGEALVRVFLAHAGAPPCPWARLTEQPALSGMAGELEELAAEEWSVGRLDDVGPVFLGEPPRVPNEQWTVARDAAARLLRLLSRTLADPGEDVRVGLTVLAADQASLSGTEGLWATGSTAGEDPRWVNPSQAAWLAHLATNQLHVAWQVARRRYLGTTHEGLQVVTDAAIDAAVDLGAPG